MFMQIYDKQCTCYVFVFVLSIAEAAVKAKADKSYAETRMVCSSYTPSVPTKVSIHVNL